MVIAPGPESVPNPSSCLIRGANGPHGLSRGLSGNTLPYLDPRARDIIHSSRRHLKERITAGGVALFANLALPIVRIVDVVKKPVGNQDKREAFRRGQGDSDIVFNFIPREIEASRIQISPATHRKSTTNLPRGIGG